MAILPERKRIVANANVYPEGFFLLIQIIKFTPLKLVHFIGCEK